MFRVTVQRGTAVTAADLFALTQRSRFASYTQYNDSQALQRSYQWLPSSERLVYEERAAAIHDELERANTVEETLLRSLTDVDSSK
jgi:hypothetical protein